MTNPYIQSITISLPANMVYGNAKYLNFLFKSRKWGTYLKYGPRSLILINTTSFTFFNSMWDIIVSFFSMLQNFGILSPGFSQNYLQIHEIKLRFDIAIPGAIFCKTGGFLKVDNNTYRSNDTRKLQRRARMPQNSGDDKESKGIQRSFVTVIQYEEGSSVILSFSGKYRKHIPFDFLALPNNELIQRLCSFAAIYLTHATNPEIFKIAPGYIPMLPKEFQSMLKEANWLNNNFRKRNITSNFYGGVFL